MGGRTPAFVTARSPQADEAIQKPQAPRALPGVLRFRLRAPRFGGLKPAVARRASEGGSLAMTGVALRCDRDDAGARRDRFGAVVHPLRQEIE
jgi:hypothetical protein